jgi:hypothetical protein
MELEYDVNIKQASMSQAVILTIPKKRNYLCHIKQSNKRERERKKNIYNNNQISCNRHRNNKHNKNS